VVRVKVDAGWSGQVCEQLLDRDAVRKTQQGGDVGASQAGAKDETCRVQQPSKAVKICMWQVVAVPDQVRRSS
jgi:hypothetical protein